MWQPDPRWEPLGQGSSPSCLGAWLAHEEGAVVVTRLLAPGPDDPPEYGDPGHPAYWRRAAEVARTGLVAATPGLRGPEALAVDEDDEGITLRHHRVAVEPTTGLFVARATGRFAAADLGERSWLARDPLPDRVRRVERNGGWPTLGRTTAADVADHLWRRRRLLLERVAALPQVPQHGDAVPANLPGRDGDDALAVDWSTLGRGPVGADLGYWSLSAREELEPLVDAYLLGLPDGLATREQVLLGARTTAVLTVLNRAEWALSRAARGEGALAGKLRHPAVAPHLRALARQAPHVEALL
ncbi:phosphotransferase [uncultured Nocardioides sp.]|uniref:phosphotransferase n=1 Tax=uncultured Nocardioides sp. TaxID=198441 RepID=UPI00262EC38A|nr:phosphotransferase [uncultured Nocardioides sp.]